LKLGLQELIVILLANKLKTYENCLPNFSMPFNYNYLKNTFTQINIHLYLGLGFLYLTAMDDLMVEKRRAQLFSIIEIAIIILLAIVPLFTTFPYRVNIYLSWEGAYRISQGQVPYKDFGMPLGYMYWIIPAFFFKLFGTQMITLIKAQVFINIVSGFAFRSILKSLSVQPGVRLLSVLLYCISFSFFNFWPWYNHTVIVYEMIALAFLMRYIFSAERKWILLSLSALFTFFSFFTKQDAGGMTLILCVALLIYSSIHEKKWMPLVIYTASFLIVAFAIIAPLLRYNLDYWFNHGQPPHTSRVSAFEIIDEFLGASQWIKFYLLLMMLLAIAYYKKRKEILIGKRDIVFLLLTLGILAEAAVMQITSYTPPDNNIFFHSFAFAFIFSSLAVYLNLNFYNYKFLFIGCFGLLLWWSGVFWKYFQRVVQRVLPITEVRTDTTENIVNRQTFMFAKTDSTDTPMSEWTYCGLKSFEKIYMPKGTAKGIQRLMRSEVVKKKDLKVLNMTELTPLAAEIGYRLETGPQIPLWYHLGVAMFNKEAKMYEQKIMDKQYDLVLFEYIPSLNNFYPFRVRDTLLNYYQKTDSFPAPRRGETQGIIEVFTRPQK
jgi:hypothetical protein